MSQSQPKTLNDLPRSVLGGHVVIAQHVRPSSAGTLEERIRLLELDRDARQFVASYAIYYDAKDLAALMALYADDAVLVNSSGTYAGAKTIEAIHSEDFPLTEISFHHLNNVSVGVPNEDGSLWVAAYMYNLAVRDGEHYGTVATIIFRLREVDGRLCAAECRIAIDSRHTLTPKLMVLQSNPLATEASTSAELVGSIPRYPS